MDDRSRGLYRKYFVQKLSDINTEAEYFVLDIKSDKFAVPALKAYIEACRNEYPLLATDLEKLVANA